MNKRPNVLLITTDQQRYDTIRLLGNPYILTPHLDTMCEQGIVYENCYSTAPICVAARVSLFSGQHPMHHGVNGNGGTDVLDTLPSLPKILTENGYQSRAFGKTHFSPMRANHGFEHVEITRDYYREAATKGLKPANHGLGQNETVPAISTVSENDSLTNWIAARSMNFLEIRDERRPFFMWTSFSKPHPPFDPCMNYWELYRDRKVPEPVYGNWSKSSSDIPIEFARESKTFGGDHNSFDQTMDARRAYYAMITQIDYNIGLILARLRELDELENTWIIFTSDHGEMLGDHHMWAKMIFNEPSVHVPCIIRTPSNFSDRSALGGTSKAEPVSLEDLYPTILGLCGIKIPDNHSIDGMDIYQEDPGNRDMVGSSHEGERHWCMEYPWSYQFEQRCGFELLFNVEEDRKQCNNLIGQESYAEVIQRMRIKMGSYLKSIGSNAVDENGMPMAENNPIDEREYRAMYNWPGYHTVHDNNDLMH